MTYEHVNGTYGRCLENRKVFDSKKILRIPPTNWTARPLNSRSEAWNLVAYVGFNIYECQISHTSNGGLRRVPFGWRKADSFETQR